MGAQVCEGPKRLEVIDGVAVVRFGLEKWRLKTRGVVAVCEESRVVGREGRMWLGAWGLWLRMWRCGFGVENGCC